jgi:2-amino-4-hydroxy-6-hydroxymethyldihydropteridine diphosphokinase
MNSANAFVALGANLPSRAGSPLETLRASLVELSRKIAIEKVSRFYKSPAWPDPKDPSFVNAVASVRTDLPAEDLLALLHKTETSFGRTRSTRNAPRTLDLDIIDYDGKVETGVLSLPHPRMHLRAFVLVPLAEIAPAWIHPALHKSVTELLAELPPNESGSVVPLN